MIHLVDVWHHYSVQPTLRGINLKIEAGEAVCVMGPNGMGKSTLLGIAAGVLAPLKGHVEIDGLRRRRSIEEEKKIRQRVAYLPDTPWLPQMATGREFVLAAGRLYGIEEDRLFDHAKRLFELFDLSKRADSPISSFSTGQRKKIGLCSALVTEAPILILDEPFSGGLDSSALHALQQVLKHLAGRDDVTILMAVPVPELVEGVADRIAIIKDGQILAFDTVAGLRERAGHSGTLTEALERLIHPEGANNIQRYFSEGKR